MEATARNVVPAGSATVFEDGLGLRYLVTAPSGESSGEALVIRPALIGARSFEFALRERVARLSTVSHPALPKLRAVDRTTGPDPTLRLVSDRVGGTRLSQLLDEAQAHDVHLDIGSALCIIRQLVAAVSALHESARDLSHGAIALERTVITAEGRLLVVEHGLGAALQQLRYTSKRYWSDLRVALPPTSGPVLFDQRVDVVQIGVMALELLIGRSLHDNEVPNRTGELLGSARAVSLRGDVEPLPSGLRRWLTRALQLDPLRSFSSAIDARAELEAILEATDEHASMVSFEAFLERMERATAPAVADVFPREVAFEPARQPAAVPQPAQRLDVDLAGIDAALARPGQSSKVAITIALPAEAQRFDDEPAIEEASVPDAEVVRAPVEEPAAHPQVPTLVIPSASAAAFSALVPSTAFVRLAPMVSVPPVVENSVPATSSSDDVEAAAPVVETDRDNLLTFARPELVEQAPEAKTASPEAPAAREALRIDAIDAAMDAAAGLTTQPASRARVAEEREAPASDVQAERPAPRSDLTRALLAGVVPAALAAVAGYAIAGGGAVGPVRAITPGVVELTTGPSGVEAFVDGTYRGLTPLRLSLTPGPHFIDLQRASADPVTVPVTLSPGMKVSQYVDVPLAEGFGLDADGELVAGVSAELSGRLVDTGEVSVVSDALLQVVEGDIVRGTSRETIELPVGRHELTLIDETSGIYTTRSVLVDGKKPAVLKVTMPTGLLMVSATPRAEVWVDGNRRGETPISALTLRAGAHDVVFRHPDLGDRKQAVVVTAGNVLRLNVDLRGK